MHAVGNFTRSSAFILFLSLLSSHAYCNSTRLDDPELHGYLVGHYLLIGKAPDSDQTYHGTVLIEEDDDGSLSVKRTIGDEVIRGTGRVETTRLTEARVLRIRFSHAGLNYEQTCLWRGDLDNYARITCHLYQEDGRTQQPGLEALFHDTR